MPTRSSRGISVAALVCSILCGVAWWSAYSTMVILHDDAKFVGALRRNLDRPEVRSQISAWTVKAIDNAAPTGAKELARHPVVRQLQTAIGSKKEIAPMTDAIVTVALRVRDSAVSQLDGKVDPKRAVDLDLAPLIGAAKIKITRQQARQLGLKLSKQTMTTPLLTAAQLDALQWPYNVITLTKTWAGWLALALLAVSLLTARRPLRTLAIACGLASLVAFLAPRMLDRVARWAATNKYASTFQPVLTATEQTLLSASMPLVIAGAVGAVVLGTGQVLLSRARRRPR